MWHSLSKVGQQVVSVSRIANGADLMLPGIIINDDKGIKVSSRLVSAFFSFLLFFLVVSVGEWGSVTFWCGSGSADPYL
jgi:hypothetical protein